MNDCENAKFALVIAGAKPMFGGPDLDKWNSFVTSVRNNVRRVEEMLIMHDNVWLIPLETEMRILCGLLEWGIDMQIPLRILFLQSEPDWIQYPPVQKPKEESEAI